MFGKWIRTGGRKSSSSSSKQGSTEPEGFQGNDDSHSAKPPSPSIQSRSSKTFLQFEASTPENEWRVNAWRMEGKNPLHGPFSFLWSCLLPKFGEALTDRI